MKITIEQDKITVEGEDMADVWHIAKLYAMYRGWIVMQPADCIRDEEVEPS